MSLLDSGMHDMTGAASIFAALGDSTRLALVDRLSTEGPLSITRLTTGSEMSRQAITKHLHVLADAHLVRDRREGREHLWELDPDQLQTARRSLERISRQWDLALGRLRKFVEE